MRVAASKPALGVLVSLPNVVSRPPLLNQTGRGDISLGSTVQPEVDSIYHRLFELDALVLLPTRHRLTFIYM